MIGWQRQQHTRMGSKQNKPLQTTQQKLQNGLDRRATQMKEAEKRLQIKAFFIILAFLGVL